jgi:pyruvate-formate lyase-activating enzyme
LAAPRAPSLVYADAEGNILDHPGMDMAGSAAGETVRPEPADLVPLPEGSELFKLTGRLPVGMDPVTGEERLLAKDPVSGGPVTAVAAFAAPAYTVLLSAPYRTEPGAPILPLFAYGAVGFRRGRFVVAAMRIDPDIRQDLRTFDAKAMARNARRRMKAEAGNRLVQHLGRCALEYGCPAARNLFLGRWEAPLPTSRGCNARCVGCISLQEGSEVCATQDRITFLPSPEEIAGVAVPHLQQADRAVASFGQGCEGEPLLEAPTIGRAIGLIRSATSRGTVNLNTNASMPDRVASLADAGLDSMRVSLSSCRERYYDRYYRPRGYRLADVVESIHVMKRRGRFVSLNYFILPGFTDEPEEVEALERLLEGTGADMIQMRNLNIDPEWYLRSIGWERRGKPVGVRALRDRLGRGFPSLRFGYFNPCLDPAARETPRRRRT